MGTPVLAVNNRCHHFSNASPTSSLVRTCGPVHSTQCRWHSSILKRRLHLQPTKLCLDIFQIQLCFLGDLYNCIGKTFHRCLSFCSIQLLGIFGPVVSWRLLGLPLEVRPTGENLSFLSSFYRALHSSTVFCHLKNHISSVIYPFVMLSYLQCYETFG